MQSKQETFSIDDLMNSPDKTTAWDGVRNYQARNFMRDEMKKGSCSPTWTSTDWTPTTGNNT